MPVCVALLRGINVGGHNKLPMAELRSLLESLGCLDVSTYIQSGNAVFKVDSLEGLETRIADAIEQDYGFRPSVLVTTDDDLIRVADENPFADEQVEQKCIHIALLLREAGNADFNRIEALKGASERYELTDRAFYLLAPDGIGRSKLAANLEASLGVPVTARNFRTVSKLVEMVDALR